MEPQLEPIEPDTAVEMYLTDRKNELAKQTLRSHKGRLKPFRIWCEDNGINDLNDLSARDTRRYKIWQSESINNVTLKSYMDTLRVFLRWSADIDAVHPDLPEKVQSPSLRRGENEKTTHIDSETAQDILDYLRKYEYATLSHVVWEILWHTGMRRGAARSLDVSDYQSEDRYLDVCHRPETDTPLKNKYEGERPVAISEAVSTVIDDWVDNQRPDVTDDYGRQPLLATDFGRVHGQTIQKYIYMWSIPCAIGQDCPHGRDPDDCDATVNRNAAHMCPSSIAPHDIRRSAITHALREDAPVTAVSDRSNVSPDVLDKHYDQMTAEEKMDKRRGYFDNI
ncbi:site-specific integrase [Haloterrigena sp. H1]|uniref:tyrosine-type recombinase/integrase n=1 Tax=Haloterrigena sp. H1 TaxID=2552943 RepID=UPI00110D7029|nr:site-specific integrase [Haloterrigena sp. H1]TMT85810.1 site-specific integrase [Haloterrigena sp. H1]